MKKKIALTILGLLLLVAAIIGIKASQIMTLIASGKNFSIPPSSVLVTEAVSKSWAPTFDTIGTIESAQGVMMSNELPGKVDRILFESGAEVKAGDVLVTLNKTSEEAQLRAADAAAELSRLNLERTQGLRKTSVVAQSELDAADAQQKNADARVQELKANLEKRTIRAPFSGRLGIRQVHEGQFLQPGTPIVSLQALDPVFVNFSLPQQRLADIFTGMKILATSDAIPGRTFQGKLTAIDAEVDAATRNIRIQGTLENKDGSLRPGMFANISAVSSQEKSHIVIPATAVVFAAYGDSVFVVNEQTDKDGKTQLIADQKFIRLGPRQGDFVAVEEGLSPGDRVVSTGSFKLRKGSPVTISTAEGPAFSTSPTLQDK